MKIGYDAKRALNNASGLGNYSRNLLNALMQYFTNEEYLLFTPKVKDEFFHQLHGDFKMLLPETQFQKALPALWRSGGLKTQLQKSRLDIYHGLSNEIPFGIKATGSATVVTIHDLIFLKHTDQYPFIDRQIYKLKTQYAAKNADRIIAVSAETKKHLVELYGIDERKIKVIHPIIGAVFENSQIREQKLDITQKYKLPAKYILNVGSFFARKNQVTLIEAFDSIKHKVEEDLVLVGGAGNLRTQVEDLIAKKGLENRVHIVANVSNEDLPAIYRAASIFVFPSLYEGFGMPIVEALLSKVAVVATKGGCFEEAGGASTIYIEPKSPAEISSAILRVLSDDRLKDEMITAGLTHAQNMSSTIIAQQTMTLYQSL